MAAPTATASSVANQTSSPSKKTIWLPLESNPEVMNKFYNLLGVKDVPSKWQLCDVYGVDEAMLAMVPQPVTAVIFLYPISDKFEKFKDDESNRALTSGKENPASLYFTKQTISNACGTVAMIHALANNTGKINIEGGSPIDNFLTATKCMTPDQRANYLVTCDDFTSAHEEFAKLGQTQAPDREESVNLHFITLVEKEGRLFELDGRKPCPVDHGPTCAESFLKDAVSVCQKYMSIEPENMHFTMLALAPPGQ